eukprot:g16690.t1
MEETTAAGAPDPDGGSKPRDGGAQVAPEASGLQAPVAPASSTYFDDHLLQATLSRQRRYERREFQSALADNVDAIIEKTRRFLAASAFLPLLVDVCGDDGLMAASPASARPCDYVYVFGDIHGAFDDLVQVLANLPEDRSFWTAEGRGKIVFVGDYGNRAPTKGDSWFTLLFMMYLQSTFPDRVTLLRGNHETSWMLSEFMAQPCEPGSDAKGSGFGEYPPCSFHSQGDEDLAARLQKVAEGVRNFVLPPEAADEEAGWFALLPQAAVVFGKAIVVHAGLSADLLPVEELRKINLHGLVEADKAIVRAKAKEAPSLEQQQRLVSLAASGRMTAMGMTPQIWRPEAVSAAGHFRRLLRGGEGRENNGEDSFCSNELHQADPSPEAVEVAKLEERDRPRCPGVFTEAAAEAYLEENKLEFVIRGHEPLLAATNPVNFRWEKFSRGNVDVADETSKVMFVFSSPYYSASAGERLAPFPTSLGSFVKLERKEDAGQRDGGLFYVESVAWQQKTKYVLGQKAESKPPNWQHLKDKRPALETTDLKLRRSVMWKMPKEFAKEPRALSVLPTVFLFGRGPFPPKAAEVGGEVDSKGVAPEPWTWQGQAKSTWIA